MASPFPTAPGRGARRIDSPRDLAGTDGNRTHRRRLSSAPQTGFEDHRGPFVFEMVPGRHVAQASPAGPVHPRSPPISPTPPPLPRHTPHPAPPHTPPH